MENIYTLASDLLNFMYDFDTYEYMDYTNGIVDDINETVSMLLDDKQYHTIFMILCEIYNESEDSVIRHESMNLMRRLESPWKF